MCVILTHARTLHRSGLPDAPPRLMGGAHGPKRAPQPNRPARTHLRNRQTKPSV